MIAFHFSTQIELMIDMRLDVEIYLYFFAVDASVFDVLDEGLIMVDFWM